jgi:hypothetical protein
MSEVLTCKRVNEGQLIKLSIILPLKLIKNYMILIIKKENNWVKYTLYNFLISFYDANLNSERRKFPSETFKGKKPFETAREHF